jgi:hypothetical protein
MIDRPLTPPNANRLLLQYRPKSLVRRDPASHVKGANWQRPSCDLRQTCGQNVQTAVFNLTNNASAAVTSPTNSALSP